MKIYAFVVAVVTAFIATVATPVTAFADTFALHGNSHHHGGYEGPADWVAIGITIGVLFVIIMTLSIFVTSLFKGKK